MSWQVILVTIAGIAIGAAVVKAFLEEIKAWAEGVLKQTIKALERAVEVVLGGIVNIIKENGKYYKDLETYMRDPNTGKNYLKETKIEIPDDKIPDEFKNKAKVTPKIKVATIAA